MPGLSGDANELYSRVIARKCLEENLDCVFVNFRGLAGVMPTVSSHLLFITSICDFKSDWTFLKFILTRSLFYIDS